jgi:hypothetical protein
MARPVQVDILGGDRVRRVRLVYAAGVVAGSAAGFCSPFWFLGFVPLSAGLVWAAYDLVEADGDKPSSAPQ